MIELKSFHIKNDNVTCTQLLRNHLTSQKWTQNKEFYRLKDEIFGYIPLFPQNIIEVAEYQNNNDKSFQFTRDYFKNINEKKIALK
jgi:hypothetical protein